MKLLEKYFMVKLDNFNDEGFRPDTMPIFVELNISGMLDREQIKAYKGDLNLAKKQNKVIQEHALDLLEKQLNERGRCQKCGGWFTSQYFEKRKQGQKEGGHKGGSKSSVKKIQACKANAARLNNSLTAEQRAEIQKKRIATMAKNREERERLKKLIES